MREPYVRGGPRSNPVVCGRKFCTGCGRWRLILDFSVHTREPLSFASRCRTCTERYRRDMFKIPFFLDRHRQQSRESKQRAARRAGVRPASEVGVGHQVVLGRRHCPKCGRWRPVSDFPGRTYKGMHVPHGACLACKRLAQRELHQRLMQDPAWRKKRKRRLREAAAVRRRQAGIPARNLSSVPLSGKSRWWSVPREPLGAAIRQWLDADPDNSINKLEEFSGVWEKRIREVLKGNGNVSVPIADELCVAIGRHLIEVYPELYMDEAA